MPYSVTTWADAPATSSPISAANLNKIETELARLKVNADLDPAAAIAYSKLALALSIVNGDVSASAAIAYSKLNLASSIVNADISASAAIAASKLALPAPPFIGQVVGINPITNPGANVAVLVPVSVPGAITITKLSWLINATSGNYDIGVYDSSLSKLVSKGSTACGTANTVQTATVGSTVIPAGIAYIALVFDNGTANFFGAGLGASAAIGTPIGQLQKATSFPLPSSLAGAAASTVPPACVTAL